MKSDKVIEVMPKRKKHVAWCNATTYGVSTGENREDWDRNYEPQTTYRLIPKQQVPDGKFASMQFTVKLSVSQRTVELTVLYQLDHGQPGLRGDHNRAHADLAGKQLSCWEDGEEYRYDMVIFTNCEH